MRKHVTSGVSSLHQRAFHVFVNTRTSALCSCACRRHPSSWWPLPLRQCQPHVQGGSAVHIRSVHDLIHSCMHSSSFPPDICFTVIAVERARRFAASLCATLSSWPMLSTTGSAATVACELFGRSLRSTVAMPLFLRARRSHDMCACACGFFALHFSVCLLIMMMSTLHGRSTSVAFAVHHGMAFGSDVCSTPHDVFYQPCGLLQLVIAVVLSPPSSPNLFDH